MPQVLENDRDLYSYLTNMELYGLCVLEDTPVEQGQVEKLAKRISFIRNCHYGSALQSSSHKENREPLRSFPLEAKIQTKDKTSSLLPLTTPSSLQARKAAAPKSP